jgi:hypothetical protein
VNAPVPDAVPDAGAFFTLSLLIDGEQIDALWRECAPDAPHTVWTQRLLEQMQTQYDDSGRLQAAINPMFDDIADRARNLFLREFLLDTPNAAPDAPGVATPSTDAAGNVCARIVLRLPGGIRWQTEGRSAVDVDLGPQRVAFAPVLCRAFWMAHSNRALSYHLSFEVPFQRGLRDYFGLAMLQKAFFASEHTDWLHDDVAAGWQVQPAGGGPTKQLLAFIEQLFEGHMHHLLQRIAEVAGVSTAPLRAVGERAWQRLVLHTDAPLDHPAAPSRAWVAAAARRRLLVVLRDAEFFDTLDAVRRDANALPTFTPFTPVASDSGASYALPALSAQIADVVAAQPPMQPPAPGHTVVHDTQQRRVQHFEQQDTLEVHDALMPIYPPPGVSGSNEGFMVYASPAVVYEVVRTSRSLDGAGRQWIGTCPYIFLVHMTAFHNESLVRAYEDNVSRLVLHLEHRGLRADADAASERFEPLLDHAFECIRDFRLVTFEQVHKHYSFNVFRYDTEQSFFQAIEHVRGVVPRREYWDKVLVHLTDTVDGLKQDRGARFERRIARIGFVLAVTGVVQTWLAIFPLPGDRGDYADLFTIGTLLLPAAAAYLLWRYRREFVRPPGRLSGKAWRWSRTAASTPPPR